MKWRALVPLPVAVLLLIVVLWFTAGCAPGEQQSFTGTVKKTDTGFLLVTDGGANTYRLDDNRDMTAVVGKTIKVTGTPMERTASKSITITRFEVVGDTPEAGDEEQGDDDKTSD